MEYASEFRYRNPVIRPNDIVITLSQSGETADTPAAVELARNSGAFIYGICNVIGSSIARATDSGSYIHVGPEIGVASTKAFTGQVTVLIMLALSVAKLKKSISPELYTTMLHDLQQIPQLMERVLKLDTEICDLAKIFTYAHNFIYLGRGYNYPVALEGALKLKEISYIHAEGYPAAEMKHGPIALIDSEMPVVAIATADSVYEKTISNIQEIKARRGKVIAIVTEGNEDVRKMVDYVIEIPRVRRTADSFGRLATVANAGLSHRREQKPRRGPATQPRQIRNRRITECCTIRHINTCCADCCSRPAQRMHSRRPNLPGTTKRANIPAPAVLP